MGFLDNFRYLSKPGLGKFMTLIKQYMDGDRHWTGTHAEYEVQKDSIPANTILHFTDDYDDNLGMPIKNMSSAAGTNTLNFAQFVSEMLMDIAPQNWENGSYAGRFTSTHSGSGYFGTWQGSYVMSKAFSGAWGSFIFGSANGLSFTAAWSGTKWAVQVHGRSVDVSGTTDANGNLPIANSTYHTMRMISIAMTGPNSVGVAHYNSDSGAAYITVYSPASGNERYINTPVSASLIINEYSN